MAAAIRVIREALRRPLAVPAEPESRYNAGPTQVLPVVIEAGAGPTLERLAWGFSVSAPGAAAGQRRLLVNARRETAQRLPAFRDAVATRRCLVPTNGFFEWRREGAARWPQLFTSRSHPALVLAGLWQAPTAEAPGAYIVLTTEANRLVRPIHDRMPVVLDPPDFAAWLTPAPLDPATYTRLTQPAPDAALALQAVDAHVNNIRHDDPRCLTPATPPCQGELWS